MTSAETDEVQVGFSRWGQDRGVALLYSVVISLQSTSFTELCICPLPYMVFTWDWWASVGVSKIYMVVEVLRDSWLADNQSHKDWKWCVSPPFKNITWTSGRGSNNGAWYISWCDKTCKEGNSTVYVVSINKLTPKVDKSFVYMCKNHYLFTSWSWDWAKLIRVCRGRRNSPSEDCWLVFGRLSILHNALECRSGHIWDTIRHSIDSFKVWIGFQKEEKAKRPQNIRNETG